MFIFCKTLLFHCLSHLTGLYGIKLSDYQSLLAQNTQAVVEDTNHLVCDSLVDETKPVLYFQPHNLLHHALVADPCWVSIWVAVSAIVVLCAVTWSISNMDKDLRKKC